MRQIQMKNPEKAWNKARKHAEAGRFDEAKRLCSKLLQGLPSNADVLYMLGYCERKLKNYPESLKALQAALDRGGENPEVLFQMGCAWHDLGNFGAAETWYRKTLELAPQWAEAWSSLGSVIGSGEKDEAIACYRKALEISPHLDGTAFNLAGLLFDENDLTPSKEALEHSLTLNPGLTRAHYYLAVIYWLMGNDAGSDECLESARSGGLDYLAESFDYMREKREENTRFFGNATDTLTYALDGVALSGMYLEFGVNYGDSIRFIASKTDHVVNGFDSFEGIPEDWGNEKKGSYSTYGQLPEVPQNVVLHQGWFSDMLPAFMEENDENLAFANIDCDLYSSTKDVFDNIGDRVKKDSILIFDEYLMVEDWKEHEFKAFQEFVASRKLRYEYLAFGLFAKQALVRIL